MSLTRLTRPASRTKTLKIPDAAADALHALLAR
jgi:hypothetical protein